jgi:cysteinyl-tRNA synthetase
MLELVGLASLAEGTDFVVGGVTMSASGTMTIDPRVVRANELLKERQTAREARDYGRADQIRDELADMGLEVRDSADGPRLVPKG